MAQIDLDVNDITSDKPKSEKNEVAQTENNYILEEGSFTRKDDGPFKKFARSMLNNTDDMGKYLLNDVVVPGLKSTILDVLSRMFYNQGFQSSSKNAFNPNSGPVKGQKTKYDNMYSKSKQHRKSHETRIIYDDIRYDEIVFDDINQAKSFVNELYSRINISEEVSIADIYNIMGRSDLSSYTDNNYGWNSVNAISLVKTPQGWWVKFDEPVRL